MNTPLPIRDVTWRLTVAYDGTSFHGWQLQKDRIRTVQDTLEMALSKVAGGHAVKVRGAGRTDAGVHARGQTASVRMKTRLTPAKMLLALASQLPPDLAVVRAEEMPHGFDAKKHSIAKRYVYGVRNGPVASPFDHRYLWHVRRPIDRDAMRAAAVHLVGELDYESFRSAQCDAAHARRHLWEVAVKDTGPETFAIHVRGNAFCRNMVRIIAGTLVDVGLGKLRAADMPRILAARDRREAGRTAPGCGLTLDTVFYPDTIDGAGIPSDAQFPGFPVTPETWPPRAGG